MPELSIWRKSLAGEPVALHENDPQEGYWRLRQKRAGHWIPVAIWRTPEGELQALRDGEVADAQDLWSWCCRYPIAYETYVAVAERREPWPEDVLSLPSSDPAGLPQISYGPLEHDPDFKHDDPRPAALSNPTSQDETSGPTEPTTAGLGHNSLGADPAGVLLAEILSLRERADAWLVVASPLTEQVEADRAANFAERFTRLEKRAEAARVAAKAPILEAGRVIDATWKPVAEQAAAGKTAMKRVLEPFLHAERERLESLQAESGTPSEPFGPRAGTQGRRIGLRRQRRLVLRDREALVRHYRRDQRFWAHDTITAVLLELAEADFLAGRPVAGAELVDTHVAA